MLRRNPERRRRELVVGLLWHSVNSDNFGIGALTQSQIAIIGKIADELGLSIRFHVFGWLDQREPYVIETNVRAVPLGVDYFLSWSDGFYAAARRCDLICDISGGDSFSDIYGLKRFAFLVLSKVIVLAARCPLVLSPQTIGPFRRFWTGQIAKQVMRRCRAIVVRDEPSRSALNGTRSGPPIVLATDVAFRLPYDPPTRHDGQVHVGLNISGLLFNGGYTRRNMFGLAADYPTLARTLLGHFTEVPNCQVHLIGHVFSATHDVEDDYRVAVALSQAFPKAIVAPRFRSPSDAKSYLAGMDFVCGSRIHACVAALSSGVPILPLAYSPKFGALFGSLGYPYLADCRTDATETIAEAVIDAFANRDRLRVAAQAANRKAAERLVAYEDVLRDCLVAAADRRP